MNIGDGRNFSINYQLLDVVGSWFLGRFYFLIAGTVVGDQDDASVDLKGCLKWLEDFVGAPRNRYEPGLFESPVDQVFSILARSVLVNEDQDNVVQELYENTYARFHLSHIGMSSFDDVTILLLENSNNEGRFIWKQGSGRISEAYVPMDEVNNVIENSIRAIRIDIADERTRILPGQA